MGKYRARYDLAAGRLIRVAWNQDPFVYSQKITVAASAISEKKVVERDSDFISENGLGNVDPTFGFDIE